jgi:hypothetical protein
MLRLTFAVARSETERELTLISSFHIIATGDGIHLEPPSEMERLMTPASWQEFFLLIRKQKSDIQALFS